LLAFLVLGMTADATTSFLTCMVTETLPERRRRGRKPSTRRCSGPARRRVRACTTLGWTLTARARQAAPPPRRRAPSMINPIHHGVTERVGRGEKREPAARSRGRGRPCAARDVRVGSRVRAGAPGTQRHRRSRSRTKPTAAASPRWRSPAAGLVADGAYR
jgi:hypothetical protein